MNRLLRSLYLLQISIILSCSQPAGNNIKSSSEINKVKNNKSSVSPQPDENSTQDGNASVYADKFQGRKTASGKKFDQNELTAASKTLPLGSKAKITNKKTGKSTTVTITDRGPYVKGREIDLSKNAAEKIGMDKKGLADVKIQSIPE